MADSNRTGPEGQDSHVDGPALSRCSFLKGAGGVAAAGGVLSAHGQAAEAARHRVTAAAAMVDDPQLKRFWSAEQMGLSAAG